MYYLRLHRERYTWYTRYIYVFIENESFCSACAHTFRLIGENPVQISINKVVQMMLTLVQSCTTPLLCSFFAFYGLNFSVSALATLSVGSLAVPAAVFAISYLMTNAFSQVRLPCSLRTTSHRYRCASAR